MCICCCVNFIDTKMHGTTMEKDKKNLTFYFAQRPNFSSAHNTQCKRGVEYCDVPATVKDRGSSVVKVLCYKSEGRWFDPRWCQWNFSLTKIPSDRTMALGSTQPLTEISTRSIFWG